MTKKKVNFIATRYKNQKVKMYFYTEDGKRVKPETVQREPMKHTVEFFVMQH